VTAACASLGQPPGGPERTTPPALVAITPESGAVNFRGRDVVFQFDVVVSDRGAGAGGELDNMFLISPREGRPRVAWRRERIEVRPRRGFRPNTAYSITLLPGIADLRGNQIRTPKTIVFSTGPTIPQFAVHGRVFDWLNERVVPNALVEVIRRPDSLPYVGTSDSTGQFSIGPLDTGSYTVRAIIDNNSNRSLDPGESWDSLAVVVRGTSPFLELLAAPRDTIAPRLLTVAAQDTLTLTASFDKPLDPALPLTPGSFRVMTADSTRLTIARVRTRAELDAARRDSIARADTVPRDTTRADSVQRIAQRLPQTAAVAGPPLPKPSQPAPPREVVLQLDTLTPMRSGGTYRVTAINARGLLGQVRSSDRVITLPVPKPDSGRAPARTPP
jgi:hypothetical protein